jgi:hypothetical protein
MIGFKLFVEQNTGQDINSLIKEFGVKKFSKPEITKFVNVAVLDMRMNDSEAEQVEKAFSAFPRVSKDQARDIIRVLDFIESK